MKAVHQSSSSIVLEAARELEEGKGILLHDSEGRENETDIVYSAIHCTPETIAHMRMEAGGLICTAIGNEVAEKLGLPFMHDVLSGISTTYPVLSSLVETSTPYGGRPAFSISLNHRTSFTGVTDRDRSATVMAIGKAAGMVASGDENARNEFISTLKAPGHVQLLIEAPGSIVERRGHTELSIRLMRIAGLPPASVVCEMLDSVTHKALSLEDAKRFAARNGMVLVEGKEIF